ncbi:MAG TPA: alpha/beta hydrolase, partial [Ktedonobacterales bacterium]|nr:alpha/beta hydrolase [Ktedonobacterales bacterium]
MSTNTSASSPATASTGERFTIGYTVGKDGATLGYRQIGQGPGVVLLHGAASSGYNHVQLAELLADARTVYVPDRRGRGLSGPFGKDYSIREDVDDLDALLTQTGARNVFGVSSGGIICLEAMLSLPAIARAAIYEPPLFLNGTTPTAMLRRYDREIAQGKLAAALITGMKGAQLGPAFFNVLPTWLLTLLINASMKGEAKKGSGGYVPMRKIAPTLHYDFQLVADRSGKLERYRAIQAEVLLMGGSTSPAYLKAALGML